MESIQVWHGTLTSGIDKFRPLTHFGTELQANRAIVAKAALDKKEEQPVLYKCILAYEKSELLNVDDIGSPTYKAIFQSYCNALKLTKFLSEKHSEATRMGLENNHDIWLTWLNELSAEKGHRVLSYDNVVEGSGLSFCVLDNQIIKDVTSMQLQWKEVKQLFDDNINEKHGYSPSEFKRMIDFLTNVVTLSSQ